ncbi:tRNA pseudouridine(55) synthase TruB [Planctomicrobium sp. SH661]|uniref:tRNA pseudouridine(55) synthase TruB n=1 Tax=Planctomicrobium sp. SH661 TaxID=3448124 RepID=UPI003F5BFE8F
MFGLLNLNKPAGVTSRDVVSRVARIVGRKVKVGHAGTLDPLATGVLVVCLGPATRLVSLIHDHQKSYEAEFLFGFRSETDDVDGTLQPVEVPASLTAETLQAALPTFMGKIQQVPPAFSAVKIDGKRAYKAARQGETFELSAREVLVSRLELKSFGWENIEVNGCDAAPVLRFALSIDCGTGTYIRSIGRDLGRLLGTEAVMSRLVRTQVGPFPVSEAIDPRSLDLTSIKEHLISPLAMLEHLRRFSVTPQESQLLGFGQTLPWPAGLATAQEPGETFAVTDSQNQLVAIAVEREGRVAPQLVFRMQD